MEKKITLAIVTDLVNFEEILPIAYFLGKSINIADINNVIKDSSYSKNIINKINIINTNHKKTFQHILISFFYKVINKLSININFIKELEFKSRYSFYDNNFFASLEKKININDISQILLRPGNDLLLRKVVMKFKVDYPTIEIIGISQAIPALKNIIHNIDDINYPTQSNFFEKGISLVYLCDKILSNSDVTFDFYKKINVDFLNKIQTIKSLRNSKKWQKLIYDDYISTNSNLENTSKTKVLILHSNFMSNINPLEVKRSIKILNKLLFISCLL